MLYTEVLNIRVTKRQKNIIRALGNGNLASGFRALINLHEQLVIYDERKDREVEGELGESKNLDFF